MVVPLCVGLGDDALVPIVVCGLGLVVTSAAVLAGTGPCVDEPGTLAGMVGGLVSAAGVIVVLDEPVLATDVAGTAFDDPWVAAVVGDAEVAGGAEPLPAGPDPLVASEPPCAVDSDVAGVGAVGMSTVPVPVVAEVKEPVDDVVVSGSLAAGVDTTPGLLGVEGALPELFVTAGVRSLDDTVDVRTALVALIPIVLGDRPVADGASDNAVVVESVAIASVVNIAVVVVSVAMTSVVTIAVVVLVVLLVGADGGVAVVSADEDALGVRAVLVVALTDAGRVVVADVADVTDVAVVVAVDDRGAAASACQHENVHHYQQHTYQPAVMVQGTLRRPHHLTPLPSNRCAKARYGNSLHLTSPDSRVHEQLTQPAA